MQIEISTDHTLSCTEERQAQVEKAVTTALDRFAGRVTRVEVHLTDANGQKGGPDDIHCTMEARLGGRPPVAVTSDAANLDQAVTAAIHKLKRLVESTLGRESSLAGQRDRG